MPTARCESCTPPGKKDAVEYIRIRTPKTESQPEEEVFREATEQDKARFVGAYRDFKSGKQKETTPTPPIASPAVLEARGEVPQTAPAPSEAQVRDLPPE